MEMNHKEVAPGVVAIAITGRVTMGPASEPIPQLVEDLLRQGARVVVFDLSGITGIENTLQARHPSIRDHRRRQRFRPGPHHPFSHSLLRH